MSVGIKFGCGQATEYLVGIEKMPWWQRVNGLEFVMIFAYCQEQQTAQVVAELGANEWDFDDDKREIEKAGSLRL